MTDSETGDIILKLVNVDSLPHQMKIDLSHFGKRNPNATLTRLTCNPNSKNTFKNPKSIVPIVSDFKVNNVFNFDIPSLSLIVIRIKTKE